MPKLTPRSPPSGTFAGRSRGRLGCPVRLSMASSASGRETAGELVEFPLGPVLGVPVPLLQLAGELVPLARDGGQVVVGQVRPLLLHLALELLPVPLDLIPVHDPPPELSEVCETPENPGSYEYAN